MKSTLHIKDLTSHAVDLDLRVSTQVDAIGNPGKHYHECTNLVFILEGRCLEKRQFQSFERRAADLAFLHAGEMHETTFTAFPTRYISLEIKPEVFAENNIDENTVLNIIKRSPDAKFLMLKIYAELLYQDDLSANSIKMLFLQFASLSQIAGHTRTLPTWVTIVYELLNDKWNENNTLKQLSEISGVNPVTISKHFPHYFACTLGNYVRKLRVERALSMMKNENISLTEVAHSCNFSDQSHFIRKFKDYTGLIPKHYRKL
ncbi:helix-turn-helix transcriptional regulator [Mucilaginibacter sp. Mucisp86]|uniref:helix-turn-helix transcriptional regulator n=1 Tax=Mucilaginibacter sp. Mucisp86 TaxID=3243060 RepID=UPI0039B6D157